MNSSRQKFYPHQRNAGIGRCVCSTAGAIHLALGLFFTSVPWLASARGDEPVTLPAVPTTLPLVSQEEGHQLSAQLRLKVGGFRFAGNTVFSGTEMSAVARPFLQAHPDGWLTSENLEQIRNALTLKYVNAGYINSGAVLPDQKVGDDGVVLFQIVEGRLTTVKLTHGEPRMMEMGGSSAPTTLPNEGPANMPGMANMHAPTEANYNAQVKPGEAPGTPPATEAAPFHLLSDSYVTGRVFASAGPPLNIVGLKNRLELLREDPNVKTVNAELKPGNLPGESELDLAVTERNPFQLGASFSNDRSPSVGAYRLDMLASDSDLTGNGDALSARWAVLEGAADSMRYAQDDDFSVDYSLPLTANDLTLLLDYTRSSDLVVETPFTDVNITSKTDDLAATLRQPIIRDPARELAGFVTVSSRYNRTFLLDEPFSFSPGARDGLSDAMALRFGPEYTLKSQTDALALRSTFSAGIEGPNATHNGNGQPDSQFFSYLGQLQYIHRLPLGRTDQPLADTEGVLRLNTQLTPDPLLNVEQFSLGGVDTVRGYRENQLVTDNAVNAGAELRMPLFEADGHPTLSLIPFVDSGYAWNVRNTIQPQLISSAGLGLAYTPNDRINARIYWGAPSKHFSHATDDLQDMGFHFDVTILAF